RRTPAQIARRESLPENQPFRGPSKPGSTWPSPVHIQPASPRDRSTSRSPASPTRMPLEMRIPGSRNQSHSNRTGAGVGSSKFQSPGGPCSFWWCQIAGVRRSPNESERDNWSLFPREVLQLHGERMKGNSRELLVHAAGEKPAVNCEQLTGNKAGSIGCQEHGCPSQFVKFAESSHWSAHPKL